MTPFFGDCVLKIWYPLAKVLAEKAAWEFAAENNMDLVTVLPSFVVGPCLPRDLSLTASDVLGLFKGTSSFSNALLILSCRLIKSDLLIVFFN